jgi:hypothetical protein
VHHLILDSEVTVANLSDWFAWFCQQLGKAQNNSTRRWLGFGKEDSWRLSGLAAAFQKTTAEAQGRQGS